MKNSRVFQLLVQWAERRWSRSNSS